MSEEVSIICLRLLRGGGGGGIFVDRGVAAGLEVDAVHVEGGEGLHVYAEVVVECHSEVFIRRQGVCAF